jgi:hypothetical protein
LSARPIWRTFACRCHQEPKIKLRIIAEGTDNPDVFGLNFFLTANGRSGFGPLPQETNKLTVRNVPPDHYDLELGGLHREFYVRTARAAETDVLVDGLTVTGAGAIDIAIPVAFDSGAVQGEFRDENQQPVSGATILLAPDRRSRADLYASTKSDQNGHCRDRHAEGAVYFYFAAMDAA